MQMKLGNVDLIQVIQDEISKSPNQIMPFKRFMSICLYHEKYGYYTSSKPKIGKEGDFYTSSAIGTIMGELLASYIIHTYETMASKMTEIPLVIVEWGAGRGHLAHHILMEIKNVSPTIYDQLQYKIIEFSPFHLEEQKTTLHEHLDKVQFISEKDLDNKESKQFTFVLANELLDAFPIHRMVQQNGLYHEIGVAWEEEEHEFIEKLIPITSDEIPDYMNEEIKSLEEGQIVEVNLEANDWITTMMERLPAGQIILIDYGAEGDELYAPHRMKGSFMCYHKHQAHDNPYVHIGEQDMTSHINFSACIHAAEQAGCTSWELKTQKQFLVDEGILNKLQNHGGLDPFHPIAKRNRSIRQLLISDQMSELFKVLVITKKDDQVYY